MIAYEQPDGSVAICSQLTSVPEGARTIEINSVPEKKYRSAWRINTAGDALELDATEQAAVDAKFQAELDAQGKLDGFDYNGMFCSVHKEDQWGLHSLESTIMGGVDIPFEFKNGNVLVLTSTNFVAFKTAWMTARASFFGVTI